MNMFLPFALDASALALGLILVTTTGALARLVRGILGTGTAVGVGGGDARRLVWYCFLLLAFGTVLSEVVGGYWTWEHEKQRQADNDQIVRDCERIKDTKLSSMNGTRSDCTEARFVKNTTALGRTVVNLGKRLVTIYTVWDWLAANWLMAATGICVAAFVWNALSERAADVAHYMQEQQRLKLLQKMERAAAAASKKIS